MITIFGAMVVIFGFMVFMAFVAWMSSTRVAWELLFWYIVIVVALTALTEVWAPILF